MTTDQLWLELERFEAKEEDGLRISRRPAGQDLIIEVYAKISSQSYPNLAAFWLASLWRFLEENHRSPQAFEGLGFQAQAQMLSRFEFTSRYQEIQKLLTLPPAHRLELKEAYLVLQGRLTSLAGFTIDDEPWALFFQAGVFTPVDEVLGGGW